jgi:hypothetical protein
MAWLTGTVARRMLARVQPHSDWLDGFRAGYLPALQADDRWVRQRVEAYTAVRPPAMAPHAFNYWAIGLVNGEPRRDEPIEGIDGQLCFRDVGRTGPKKRMPLAARETAPTVEDVRQLAAATDRARAEMGAVISRRPAGRRVQAEAARAGSYMSPLCGEAFPRIRCVTVGELLNGEGLNYPGSRSNLSGENATSARAAAPTVLQTP